MTHAAPQHPHTHNHNTCADMAAQVTTHNKSCSTIQSCFSPQSTCVNSQHKATKHMTHSHARSEIVLPCQYLFGGIMVCDHQRVSDSTAPCECLVSSPESFACTIDSLAHYMKFNTTHPQVPNFYLHPAQMAEQKLTR